MIFVSLKQLLVITVLYVYHIWFVLFVKDFKNSFSGLSGTPLETPKKRTRAYSSLPKLSHSDSGQKMVEEQTSQAEVSEGTPGGLLNKLESGSAAESCEDISELDASEVKVTSSSSKTFSAKVTKVFLIMW